MPDETIVRKVTERIDFSSVNRELCILEFDPAELKDCLMRFQAQPAVEPLIAAQSFQGVKDLRFYIDAIDCTPEILQSIHNSMTRIPADQLKSQYKVGADRWLEISRRLEGEAIYLANREFLRRYLREDIASSFTALGDRSFGVSGCLHPINFLYRYIPIPPVSLKAAFASALRRLGLPDRAMNSVSPLQVLISQGPAPSLEDFDAVTDQPRGRLNVFLEFHFPDDLLALLEEIDRKVGNIQRYLDVQRDRYLNPIKNDLDTLTIDLAASGTVLGTKIDQIRALVDRLFP